jgi:hypothetical protein
MTHPRIKKAAAKYRGVDMKKLCEPPGIEYIGDQPEHPINKEGASIFMSSPRQNAHLRPFESGDGSA